MHDFEVTFSAAWTDQHGVTWSTGKQKKIIKARDRQGAVAAVRSTWPQGAIGLCSAELVTTPLLDMVKANIAAGRPASAWSDAALFLQEWPTVGWLQQ